jgi:hypothetical protein
MDLPFLLEEMCGEREGPSGERPAGGPAGTRFTELAGRGGRLPTDNEGIGIYGGEGCRGKRKVVCYPAGGGGQAAFSTTEGSWPAAPLPRPPPPPRIATATVPRSCHVGRPQGPPSHIFEPAAKAPLQLLTNPGNI